VLDIVKPEFELVPPTVLLLLADAPAFMSSEVKAATVVPIAARTDNPDLPFKVFEYCRNIPVVVKEGLASRLILFEESCLNILFNYFLEK